MVTEDLCHEQRTLLALTRRHFFGQCGVGVGKIALASLLAESLARRGRGADGQTASGESTGAEAAALCAAGEAGDSFVHGGGAEPTRSVRQQTETHRVRRAADSARGDRRTALCIHSLRCRGDGAAVQVRPAWTERRGIVGSAAASGWRGRRHLPGQVGPHRSVQSCTGPNLFEHRVFAARDGRASARGSLMAWEPKRANCRRLSSCRPAAASAAEQPTGRAAFCRPFMPACDFAIKETRSST